MVNLIALMAEQPSSNMVQPATIGIVAIIYSRDKATGDYAIRAKLTAANMTVLGQIGS